MKKFTLVLLACLFFITLSFAGTAKPNTESAQTTRTDEILAEIDRQIGMPDLSNYQQKRLMKMVYELCDKADLVCYAYLKSDYNGKPVFLGKCIGFGIPFSAQYTNPMKHKGYTNDGYTIPQADPNGLYMPTSSSATWLMLINPETGEPELSYIEPEIIVVTFPLPGIAIK